MKILIFCDSPFLGDNIRLFNLITTLQASIEDCDLWYLGSNQFNPIPGVLKDYNIKIQTLPMTIKNFGSEWEHILKARAEVKKTQKKDFDLVIHLGSNFKQTMVLRQIPSRYFYASTWGFLFCSRWGKYQKTKNDPTVIASNLAYMLNRKIPITPYSIKRIDERLYQEAKKLLPKDNYVGFAITQGHPTRKKTWSLDHFIHIANEVSFRGDQPVFLVERSHQDVIKTIKKEVPGALFPELESSHACPALVTTLALRMKMAISIDCGVMHMIGLANIPMIVLFGPTSAEKFAPRIDQIQVLESQVLYQSPDIDKITVDDVTREMDNLYRLLDNQAIDRQVAKEIADEKPLK